MIALIAMTVLLALPLSQCFADQPPQTPAEACKAKANFQYQFDMMKIEGDEIRNSISHREADEKKSELLQSHKDVLEDCEDLD